MTKDAIHRHGLPARWRLHRILESGGVGKHQAKVDLNKLAKWWVNFPSDSDDFWDRFHGADDGVYDDGKGPLRPQFS